MQHQQIVAYVCIYDTVIVYKNFIFSEHLRSTHVQKLKRTIEPL